MSALQTMRWATICNDGTALSRCQYSGINPHSTNDAAATHGPLRWRDLQTGGAVIPPGVTLDDPVEFVVSMDRQ